MQQQQQQQQQTKLPPISGSGQYFSLLHVGPSFHWPIHIANFRFASIDIYWLSTTYSSSSTAKGSSMACISS